MKKVFLYSFVFLGGVILIMACTSTSTEDLTEPIKADVITYTEHVKPIITVNCIRCHANPPINGAPMPLTTYEDVKNAVINRGLLDRIQRPAGVAGAMPFGGPPLPQNLIDVIIEWEADGLVE